MRIKIFLLLCAALFTTAADAQKISADNVPAVVASAFKTRFPNSTNVRWEMEKQNQYEVNFKRNGSEMSANFDNSGKWLETETEIKVSALPATITSTLKNEFAGFKINEASKIESAANGNCFEAEIEKGEATYDVLLTADGKIVSKTKVEKEKEDKD